MQLVTTIIIIIIPSSETLRLWEQQLQASQQ